MIEFCIRPAAERDELSLQRLWRQLDDLHAELQPRFFAPGQRRSTQSDPSQDRLTQVLVADDGDDIIGALRVRVYDTPRDPLMVPMRRGFVEEMVVDRDHRRQGVGRRLMEDAAAWCLERGAAEILLSVWSGNEGAEAFYRRLGYGEVNRVLAHPLRG